MSQPTRAKEAPWTRREVLGAGAGVVSLTVIGCAAKLPPAREVTPEAGEVTLRLADAQEELSRPGGAITLEVAGVKKPILLVRGEGDTYRAILLKCTHLGCTVGYDEAAGALACPCHGSRFDISGAVTHGPAKAPLTTFPVTVDGEALRFRPS